MNVTDILKAILSEIRIVRCVVMKQTATKEYEDAVRDARSALKAEDSFEDNPWEYLKTKRKDPYKAAEELLLGKIHKDLKKKFKKKTTKKKTKKKVLK